MSVCYRDAWESAHPGEPGDEHGGPTLAVQTCTLAFDEPVDGVWASDHFGVLADLDLSARV